MPGEWVRVFWRSLASRNENGVGEMRDEESGGDCFPALGEGFRINVPLL